MYDLPNRIQEPPLPHLLGTEDLPDPEPRGRYPRLFHVPSLPNPRSFWDVIKWWERRRIPYNLIIGGIGAVGYAFIVIPWLRHGQPRGHYPFHNTVEAIDVPFEILFVMNVAYTAGAFIELCLFVPGVRHRRIGPVLLAFGAAISLIIVGGGTLVAILACL